MKILILLLLVIGRMGHAAIKDLPPELAGHSEAELELLTANAISSHFNCELYSTTSVRALVSAARFAAPAMIKTKVQLPEGVCYGRGSYLCVATFASLKKSAERFTPPAVTCETAESIDIFSSFDTPGYNEIDDRGLNSGFEIELADAIFESQGYSVRWLPKPWTDIVADLEQNSGDKSYGYIAGIEARVERQAHWLFATLNEFDASHYFFGKTARGFETGAILDSVTGKSIDRFILDSPANLVDGRKLKIATWKGSAFELELRRAFPNPINLEILALEDGDPMAWLADDQADLVYVFASGPKNSYTDAGHVIAGGPITNFDLDRFGGTSPVLPMNYFGQKINRVWSDGFAAITRDDTFFEISMKWFGRVSWPSEFNDFMLSDPAAFKKRATKFENDWNAKP